MSGLEIPAYTLSGLNINPGLVLSPMSGVTNGPFRRLIKELNPGNVGLVMTEFISVEGLTRKIPSCMQMMSYKEFERPFGVQIFGHDIARMQDAALMVQDAGADLVDLNCGCPAPKVVRRGGGCELMRQPEHLRKIIQAIRKAVKIPFTIKVRSGWDSDSLNALEIGKIAEEEGVEGIAIHGRSRAQLYRGEADWNIVKILCEELTIPVFGSGDIVDVASATVRLASGVKGLFIGRGAISNPLIFSELINGKFAPGTESHIRCLDILERYSELLLEELRPLNALGKLKQISSQMCSKRWTWRKSLLRSKSIEEFLDITRSSRVLDDTKIENFTDEQQNYAFG